ncbi:hypothetical protein HY639_03420 [Candidatus Woesearchaeota archaeon]|nr:hypothetical protein [Candidatus Woesearchaeota archaeon]
MNKDTLFFGAILITALIILGYALFPQSPTVPKFASKSTGSTDNGDVLVELQPMGVENGQFTISIRVNTHSVDLSSIDLMQQVAFESNGQSVKPTSGLQLSGHHASGKLSFPVAVPAQFTVRIRGIPLQQERVYMW